MTVGEMHKLVLLLLFCSPTPKSTMALVLGRCLNPGSPGTCGCHPVHVQPATEKAPGITREWLYLGIIRAFCSFPNVPPLRHEAAGLQPWLSSTSQLS